MLPKRTAVPAALPATALTWTVAPGVGVVKTAPRRTLLLKKSAGIALGAMNGSATPSQLILRNPFATGLFVVLLIPPRPMSARYAVTAAVISAAVAPAAVVTLGAAEAARGASPRAATTENRSFFIRKCRRRRVKLERAADDPF